MNNSHVVPFGKLFAVGLLSTSLAACVGGGNSNSSVTISSSEDVVSSVASSLPVSSVASSSSQAPASSSEESSSSSEVIVESSSVASSSIAPSSSSEMSSSSVMSSSSEPADICGPLIEKGDGLYNTQGFACKTCHGDVMGAETDGEGKNGGPIATTVSPYGTPPDSHPELDQYIAEYMKMWAPLSTSSDIPGDAEAIAAYLYSEAGWDWCDDGDTTSSEGTSSSTENTSSSQASGFITSCDEASASDLRECVDFENVSPGSSPEGFVIEGGAVSVVSGEEAYSGNTALKVSTQQGSGYMKLRNFSATHWGRLYYKNTKKQENFSNWSHTTLVASQGGAGTFRFLDTVAAPTSEDYYGTHQHLYNTEPNDLSLEGAYDQEFEAVWKCFEWSVDTDAQTYHAYLDEQEIPLANGYDADQTITNSTDMANAIKWDGNRYPMTPIPATLDWIGFGIQNYQNHSNYEFYLDDIAIGNERIGCAVTPSGS